jgi:DNA-directed RNA polymerase beta subunit
MFPRIYCSNNLKEYIRLFLQLQVMYLRKKNFFPVKRIILENLTTENHEKMWFFEIPNLLEIQRASFFTFLKFGLHNEIKNRQAWFYTQKFEWTFYPKHLRFETPIQSCQEAFRSGGNYSASLIIPRSLYDRDCRKIRFEWVALGVLPLLTRQGHFMVNGSPRVCITQVVRGPGIYMGRKSEVNGKVVFYADIVPERGAWVRIEKDSKNQVWLRMCKKPRLSLWSVLKTIGLHSFFSYFDSSLIQLQRLSPRISPYLTQAIY